MVDREIREKLANHLKNRIDSNLEKLYIKIGNDIRYYTIYPLIMLEEYNYKEVPHTIGNLIRRGAVSWFLINSYSYRQTNYNNLKYHHVQYEKFKTVIYPFIEKVYQDYRNYIEVCDHSSYARSVIKKIDSSNWRIMTSFVENKYNAEEFYFNRLFDRDYFVVEKKKVRELQLKFGKAALDSINRRDEIKKSDLVSLSRERLELDLNFLGHNLISPVLPDYNDFKSILSCIYYVAFSKLAKTDLIKEITNKLDLKKIIVCECKETFIEKIVNLSQSDTLSVKKTLEYLTLKQEGGILQFPLLELNNHYVFNPASIVVNDWHFSIVDGHYCRNVDFANRDEMISTKVVSLIDDVSKNLSNIVSIKEKYYEFVDSEGEIQKSDIDYAMYDVHSNKLLVIECKWKINHFLSEVDYNHIKIHQGLFKICNKQLSKHREFLSNKESVNLIFDNDERINQINEMPEIFYMIVDKRNQLYLEGEVMMPVYMLVTFLKALNNNNSVNLERLINHIKTLETTTKWFQILDEKEIRLGDESIFSDDIEEDSYFSFA